MSTEQQGQEVSPVLQKSEGVTQTERYLQRLAEKSFLSLWSYPNVHKNEGLTKKNGTSQEVCDLLVVFENHLIIFSDKDYAFPNTGNLDLDCSRWYRKAILKSAQQILGNRSIETLPAGAAAGKVQEVSRIVQHFSMTDKVFDFFALNQAVLK